MMSKKPKPWLAAGHGSFALPAICFSLACTAAWLLLGIYSDIRTIKVMLNGGGMPQPQTAQQVQQPLQQQLHSAQQPTAAGGAYTAAAIRNITQYRSHMLSHVAKAWEKNAKYPGDGLLKEEWDLFAPIITCPPDRPLTLYGASGQLGGVTPDGAKFFCQLKNTGKCVIYSLGSNGDYKFEEAMLAQTSCDVHTFDCTYQAGRSLNPRHAFHKWCLGDPADGPDYRTWGNITQSLGHTSGVDVLKMDIEGYEYPILGEFQPDDVLPEQFAVEFHVGFINMLHKTDNIPQSKASLALVMMHLLNLGYGSYSQDTYPKSPNCCSDLAFFRFPGAAARAAGTAL